MEYIEVSGKTVDEALTNALVKLETTSDKVEYEVLCLNFYLLFSFFTIFIIFILVYTNIVVQTIS